MRKSIFILIVVAFVSLMLISCSSGGVVQIPDRTVESQSIFDDSITEYYEDGNQTIVIGKGENEAGETVELWRKVVNKGDNGEVASEQYFRDGELLSKKTYEYDEGAISSRDGSVISCIKFYNAKDQLAEKEVYVYNNSGKMTDMIRYHVNGQDEEELYRYRYEYNEAGLFDKEKYYNAYHPSEIYFYYQYRYNEQNQLIEWEAHNDFDYDGVFELVEKYTYTYNDQNYIATESYYLYNDETQQYDLVWICEFGYDDSGEKNSMEKRDSEGNLIGRISYK